MRPVSIMPEAVPGKSAATVWRRRSEATGRLPLENSGLCKIVVQNAYK